MASPVKSLPDLPSELIDNILAYLSPFDLASVCRVDNFMRAHALKDLHWRSLVQANVPGVDLTTAGPCASFRELYIAHDPHWFLTKYKVWFSDKDLTGKLILARYDQSRGVIEGFQLLANRKRPSSLASDFEPELKLHLEKPVMQLRANSLENIMRATKTKALPPVVTPPSAANGLNSIAQRWLNASAAPAAPLQAPVQPHRFAAEKPMPLEGRPISTFNNFILTKALPEPDVEDRSSRGFPYGNIWPPPAIPAAERVSAAHYMNGSRMVVDHMQAEVAPLEDRPSKRSEISEKTFRIRSWLERPALSASFSLGPLLSDWTHDASDGLFGQSTQQWHPSPPTSSSYPAHIWDSVTTYSTLDPDMYTPTADQPWKGIWVGDYSGHGCEFLLLKQHHATPFDAAAFDATRTEVETDAEFALRKADARKYRGSLEAVKLTGDPNVPRGECTFVAADLADEDDGAAIEDDKFKGTRVVRSQGHVAMTGFLNGKSTAFALCS